MADLVTTITAENCISEIERHFKISAGPGAGKTRWLTNHIKNVVRNSSRLGNSRKIACITFTNVASETILLRLGTQVNRVEVSTIHSFLYNNLIKPFAFLIPREFELDISKIDGHDDIPVYKGFLYEWKKNTQQTYLRDDTKVTIALRDLAWHFQNGELVLKTREVYRAKIGKYNIKKDSFVEYRKMLWRKGLLDHDDVLFFSLTLIRTQPRVLEVLRAKFPYFFIDEFQDTNPIQTEIIQRIAEKETIVGVIGDFAQSIYGFQGAMPEQFANFTLPRIMLYTIADNHRATKNIVGLLNSIRTDLKQYSIRGVDGNPLLFFAGSKFWALTQAIDRANGDVHSLTRSNLTANALRDGLEVSSGNLVNDMREQDSNGSRAEVIIAAMTSVGLANLSRFKEALKILSKELRRSVQDFDIQKKALEILKILMSKYSEYKKGNLLDFYSMIVQLFPVELSGLKKGAAKTYYENNSFEKVALSLVMNDEVSLHRTIHRAKGAEFENVLIVLDVDRKGQFNEAKELAFILKPDLAADEEHRVYYVALSRARQSLFLNAPKLSPATAEQLRALGFTVIFQN